MLVNCCTTQCALRYVSAVEKSRASFATCHVAHSSFAERFGFARWLAHLVTGDAPGWAEIGRSVERTGQAVSGWALLPTAPRDYLVHAPLAECLGVAEAWLVRNDGTPPRAELWEVWVRERRRAAQRAAAKRTAEQAQRDAAPTGRNYRQLSDAQMARAEEVSQARDATAAAAHPAAKPPRKRKRRAGQSTPRTRDVED